jgi:hypothetical protein
LFVIGERFKAVSLFFNLFHRRRSAMATMTAKNLLPSSYCVALNVVTLKNGMGCDMVARGDLATPLSSHQRSQSGPRMLWHCNSADNFGAAWSAARAGRSERCPGVTAFGSPSIKWGEVNAVRHSLTGWSYRGLALSVRVAPARDIATSLKPLQARFAGKQPAGVSAFAMKRG